MSMNALFGQAVGQLQGQNFKNPDVQKLVDVLSSIFSDTSPIQLTSQLQFESGLSQPAITIVVNGDARGIQMTNAAGQLASVGIGLGNEGIVANEFLPRPEYALPAAAAQQVSTGSTQAGSYDFVPGSTPTQTRPNNFPPFSGPSVLPNNTPNDVGGVTGQTGSGRGRGSGYQSYIGPPARIGQEVASGGGAGSGGGFVGPPAVKFAGQTPKLVGPPVGTGIPGRTHANMQSLGGWGAPLAYGRHGSAGFEVSVNNTRYIWPKAAGASGAGVTGTQTIVTAVSCSGGSLSVTTAVLNFENGLYTGTT